MDSQHDHQFRFLEYPVEAVTNNLIHDTTLEEFLGQWT